MNLFKRIASALSGASPQEDLTSSYPSAAFDGAHEFRAYPAKSLLKDQGVFAYRLEFATFEADANLVMNALTSQFDWPLHEPFQEGKARQGNKSTHFSIRREFGGAVIVMVTNSTELITRIDALDLQPPPPWLVFPHADPLTLGSLQGSMEYWWDWLFSPFWNTLDAEDREIYLKRYSANQDWGDFLSAHSR
jgi:hypothetical protein